MSEKRHSTYRLGMWAAPVVALLLLGGLVLERQSWPEPDDVSGYHQSVRQAVHSVPQKIGPWQGSDKPLQEGAIALLKPNAILSRSYKHEASGRAFRYLIVQCRDARDMLGHYPPRCYPNQGWRMTDAERTEWQVDQTTLAGKRYKMEKALRGRLWRQSVINMILLPNGDFGMDMADVNQVAANRQFRVYGAAQVQMVFGDNFSPAEQHRIAKRFIDASKRVVESVRRGEQ